MGASISSLVFQPPPVTYLQTKSSLIWLNTSSDISFPAYYIDRKSKITILFSHGNAEDIGMFYETFCEFAQQVKVNFLAYDYAGYGKSSGTPSEKGCYECIDAAYLFLSETLKIPSQQIVLYGRSVGSGPSCYLAEKLHRQKKVLGGMILQAPLLSIFRVAFNFRFTMPYDLFPNIDRIKNTHCPVFVIHGIKDEVVPFWHGEELFIATPVKMRAKPLWVENAGHNDLEAVLRTKLYLHISSFLSEWVPLYNYTVKSPHSTPIKRGIVGKPLWCQTTDDFL